MSAEREHVREPTSPMNEGPTHDEAQDDEAHEDEAHEDEALTRRAIEACARRGLYGDDVFLVLALLERPEATWPACCETGCEPCMKTLHAAAREALGRTPTE